MWQKLNSMGDLWDPISPKRRPIRKKFIWTCSILFTCFFISGRFPTFSRTLCIYTGCPRRVVRPYNFFGFEDNGMKFVGFVYDIKWHFLTGDSILWHFRFNRKWHKLSIFKWDAWYILTYFISIWHSKHNHVSLVTFCHQDRKSVV